MTLSKKWFGRGKKMLEMQRVADKFFVWSDEQLFTREALGWATKTIGFTPLHEETFPKVSNVISGGRNQLGSWLDPLFFLVVLNRPWCSVKYV